MNINWKSLIASIVLVCFVYSIVLIFRYRDISWSSSSILFFVIMFCFWTLVLYFVFKFEKKRRMKEDRPLAHK